MCNLFFVVAHMWCAGFAVLVEKDWLAFGHQFEWRHGQVVGDEQKKRERAPIFLQFLSCAWQLMCQHPTAFEFSSAFLVKLHIESVSGFCGSFAGACRCMIFARLNCS